MAPAEAGFPSLTAQPPGGGLTPPPRRPTAGGHLAYARRRLRRASTHVPGPMDTYAQPLPRMVSLFLIMHSLNCITYYLH
jgi:hypothetical protein